MGAILERKAPRTWERPRMRDFWEVEIICHFTEEPWVQNFGMTHLTFDMQEDLLRCLLHHHLGSQAFSVLRNSSFSPKLAY